MTSPSRPNSENFPPPPTPTRMVVASADSASTFTPFQSRARLVTTLIRPSMAFEPYITEPGPTMTSMWSMNSIGMPAPTPKKTLPRICSLTVWPSSSSRKWLPRSPVMRTPRAPISPPFRLSELATPSDRKSMASLSVLMP